MFNIVVSHEVFDMTKDEAKRVKKFRQDVLDYLIGMKLDPEGVEHAECEAMIDEIENRYDPDEYVRELH